MVLARAGSSPSELRWEVLAAARPLTPTDFQLRVSQARIPTGTVEDVGRPWDAAVRCHEPKEKSPMTVRWKPLLILSGLFVVIAVVGVITMAYTLIPRGSGDFLPQARADRAAKQFEKAEVRYKQALQMDSHNPSLHEEMAGFYKEWAASAPPEVRAKLQMQRIQALSQARAMGKSLPEPRRQLLADAMARDLSGDAVTLARELVDLDPKSVDSYYVLASEGLEYASPNVPEIKKQLAQLVTLKASPVRVAWVRTKLAQYTGDNVAMRESLDASRGLTLTEKDPSVDHLALLRLLALDVQTTTDPEALASRVKALQVEARALLAGTDLAPTRITRLSLLLEQIQKSLMITASKLPAKSKAEVTQLVDTIEGDVNGLFTRALEPANKPELSLYLTYADHLRFRQKREQCLEVIETALRNPMAGRAANADTVLGLHAVAVQTALAKSEDKNRFQTAKPHIDKLIESSSNRFKGLGHLFQGAIDLEQSGVATNSGVPTDGPAPSPGTQLKLRTSALNHLKIAAKELPDVAEAQARYGVALVLSKEQALGRQYLLNALRLGNLDPQYQVWAAWSMVQAGYPEEAEPIVSTLLDQIAQGRQSSDLEGTLHLLRGEIHQARRTPEELRLALAEYRKAVDSGIRLTPPVQLRLAQIEVQLGRPEDGLKRIESLRKEAQGGPSAEHLAVLTLQEQGKKDEARAALDAARKRFPDSEELVGLDAAMLARSERKEDADKVLTEFLKRSPDNIGVILMRVQILSELLDNQKEARKLLVSVADRSENSAPLVQLALLDLKQHDHNAVADSIAKIRGRWKEAAIADLLDAQLSLDQGDISSAVTHFDAALKKDPGNKLVQFWKAQLDSRNGATKNAAASLEAIAQAKPTKEVDSGLSLMAAAESALANISLQSGDIDGAIQRLEDLRKKNSGQLGGLTRNDRWQLAIAYASKSQWNAAKREVAALLNDPKNPPTADERVRGANFYRIHDDNAAALAQLDYVIKVDPSHPSAVVTRSYILSHSENKNAEAVAMLHRAIEATKGTPPAVFYLMLAAIETTTPPAEDSAKRALDVLDQGLKVQPESLELVQAKYRFLLKKRGEAEALAFVESKGKNGPKPLRRLLVEAYREKKDYVAAEQILRDMLKENPKDSQVAANLVRIVAIQAVDAAEHDRRDRERIFNDKAAGLIREFRGKFPNDLAFLQAECDLAARKGDLARATALTQEMDKVAKTSPAGPLTRARIFTAQGRLNEAASSYVEALDRNPRMFDVRILLGQVNFRLGRFDEAVHQAKLVLEVDKDQQDAILLEARATAARPGTTAQVTQARRRAVDQLTSALKKNPKFVDGYHLKAELQMALGESDRAIATLKENVKVVSDDPAGLAQLIEYLSEKRGPDGKPTQAAVSEVEAVASAAGDGDKAGNMMLAIAVGYHKAGDLERALGWAQKAAGKLDTPLVHLNYGDLLLSLAEGTGNTEKAKETFTKAVEQYKLVLKGQANSVEAINNMAWVLHNYLGKSTEALNLAQGLVRRVDPATLPGEFFDTLGTIQSAMGQTRAAEESFNKGLAKSPDLPVLNFHMGQLIASDRSRSSQANNYLKKALAGRSRLSQPMVADLLALVSKLGIKAN